jgi:hypothetical protein
MVEKHMLLNTELFINLLGYPHNTTYLYVTMQRVTNSNDIYLNTVLRLKQS